MPTPAATTAYRAASSDMLEQELRLLYRQLAQLLGWTLQYHTHDARRSDEGWPDDVLLRPSDGRVLFVEAKGRAGRVSDAQRAWLDGLGAAGLDVVVWRPADWLDGTIEAVLRR